MLSAVIEGPLLLGAPHLHMSTAWVFLRAIFTRLGCSHHIQEILGMAISVAGRFHTDCSTAK